ncbi:MAG: energy-coupling factor transporter transmembrane protein EcfT [Spirochaetales bacterium]|nr:energy-coupling factor transporter transmembrane protein EcfT [Spirochaetales bacterium]
MLKDINLGRYHHGSSFLHRLDPRTKLAFLIVYIVCVFLARSVLQCSLCLLVLVALVALSEVPLTFMFRGLRTPLVVLLIVDVMNIILLDDGLRISVLLTLRITEVVLASNLLTLTTLPKQIADGLEKSLSWLRIFRVPVHDIATMVAVAFRFIPILTQEARDLMDAQTMRGADFSHGSLVKRARALGPLAVTVFASAFRRADETALAMDSRLYGLSSSGSCGSRLHPLAFTHEDAAAFICIFCFLTVMILMRAGGL